jgi:hypothetical protein
MNATIERMNRSSGLRQDVQWGITTALFFSRGFGLIALPAVGLSLLALGVYWFTGTTVPRSVHVALWALPVYAFGGVSGGAILGLLRGLTRNWIGRRVVSALVVLPVSFAAGYALLFGMDGWDQRAVLFCLGFAVVWGGIMGFIFESDAKAYWASASRTGRPHLRR